MSKRDFNNLPELHLSKCCSHCVFAQRLNTYSAMCFLARGVPCPRTPHLDYYGYGGLSSAWAALNGAINAKSAGRSAVVNGQLELGKYESFTKLFLIYAHGFYSHSPKRKGALFVFPPDADKDFDRLLSPDEFADLVDRECKGMGLTPEQTKEVVAKAVEWHEDVIALARFYFDPATHSTLRRRVDNRAVCAAFSPRSDVAVDGAKDFLP